MEQINFFSEVIDFKLSNLEKISIWLENCISSEGHELIQLNFIFCDDEYLHQINVEYLNHDTFTDIITFDQSEKPSEIEGDIYISIPRVEENAESFEVTFKKELHRVLIHGVLHLLGYGDKTEEEIKQMREKEEEYINLLSSNK